MSNDEPVLRFNRPLRAVRDREEGAEAAREARRVKTVEQLQVAEKQEELQQRAAELARREADLTRRAEELDRRERMIDEKLEELAELIGSVKEEKLDMLEANEEEIVSFSLSITEKVLQHEIEQGRYKITEVVKSALRAVRDKGALVVRVNPRDYEMTCKAAEQLAQSYGRTNITTVPDDSIPLASCCIETDSGKIFSEIPGRLAKIEKSLLKKNGESNGV
ncbi:MAG: FliH/SctL family protein [Planctomycetota bacterium]